MSNALPNLKGRVAFIFEERDFDVDQIIGVKNIKIQDVDELAVESGGQLAKLCHRDAAVGFGLLRLDQGGGGDVQAGDTWHAGMLPE